MSTLTRLKSGLTVEQYNERTAEQKHAEVVEQINDTKVYDYESKTATFSNMRVTSMKTCRRVKISEPLPEKEEAQLQSVISAVENAINREAARNKSLRIKPSTLTRSEALGLKSLKKRTKRGQAALVATDKSGKMSVIDKINYDRLVAVHTSKDQVISEQEVIELETVLSATSSSVARILKIGDKWDQKDRVQSAAKSTLSSIPPLAILLKDHKPGSDKPVRPLCRSAESPNGPLSELTSDVMNIVANELNSRQLTEVKSTEEMCSILDSINDRVQPDFSCLEACGVIEQNLLSSHNLSQHPDHLPELVIGSMDVKALYPSLDIDHSSQIIEKLISESQVNFDCDVLDMALHIAATNTQLQINNYGLKEVIHTRRFKHGVRPTIISKSVTGTEKEREESNSWIPPVRAPTLAETKQMLALVISQAVNLVMKSHVYTNSDTIWKQLFGGAIGIRATCEVAKLVMLEHDRILWNKVEEAGITKIDSGRYVDDENPTFKPTPFGARLVNGKIQVIPEHIVSDKQVPHDKRTFNLVLEIANSIWEHIQFTMEVPSDSETGYIPVLDMQVAINQIGQVTRRFYTKPMNTPFTILARSAHSWQTKRSTLTQEGVRRMLNTSVNTPIEHRNTILSEWDMKMNLSGYNKSFRGNVIANAIKIYNQKLLTAQQGGQPVHRPTGWNASDREMQKHVNKHTWYHGKSKVSNQAPLIIDATSSGKLESELKTILSDASKTTGINIKLCVRGGRKISKNAQSDPFASRLCSRNSCKVCTSTDSQGGCKQASIGYVLSCDPCADSEIEATYHGESSKSAFERGTQHAKGLLKKAEDNPIWKHSEIHHQGDNKIWFSMKVTGRFAKPMIRQENEAIRIRESNSVHEMNSRSEYHQPVIIRLIPTSSNLQSDQSGTPAPIMYPSHQNKRKASPLRRPDSPNVESRSKFVRYNQSEDHHTSRQSRQDYYYQSKHSANSRQSSRDQHYEPSQISSTRSERRQSSDKRHRGDYYVSQSREHRGSHNSYKNSNSRHRSNSTHSYNKKSNSNHNTHPKTPSHKEPTPPKPISKRLSPLPHKISHQAQNSNHVSKQHEQNLSLSPVSPDNFSFAMRNLRSKGKFAYRVQTMNTHVTENSETISTSITRSDSTRHYAMQSAVSRSVMRNHPSTVASKSPVNPTVKSPEASNSNLGDVEDVEVLSQVSQVPFTQACKILSNSKVIAQVSKTSKTLSTHNTITPQSQSTTYLPQDLSVEFDLSMSEDDFNNVSLSLTNDNNSISQLERDATNALNREDIRVEQVKYALDNPITTLKGLNDLRERRKRESRTTNNSFSTSNTVKNKLEPEKSKNSSKTTKTTPKTSKNTIITKKKVSKNIPIKKLPKSVVKK